MSWQNRDCTLTYTDEEKNGDKPVGSEKSCHFELDTFMQGKLMQQSRQFSDDSPKERQKVLNPLQLVDCNHGDSELQQSIRDAIMLQWLV